MSILGSPGPCSSLLSIGQSSKEPIRLWGAHSYSFPKTPVARPGSETLSYPSCKGHCLLEAAARPQPSTLSAFIKNKSYLPSLSPECDPDHPFPSRHPRLLPSYRTPTETFLNTQLSSRPVSLSPSPSPPHSATKLSLST